MPVPRTEDVAAGFQATAERLDVLETRIPVGGSTGQVLAKASGANYDTEWVDQTGGGGVIPPFPISDITGLQTALDGKQPLDADLTSIASLTTTSFGRNQLTYSDASEAKSVLSLAKADVGLANVDNTSDANKPVSTATQTALNLKANLASPTFTGTVGGITAAMVGLGNVTNTSDANKPVSTAQQAALDLKSPIANPTFTGTVSGISKAMVGLGNVDNTSDANKPVSTAQQTALDGKQPLDGDLTSLAAASGTNTIYYRSAANTWSPVTIGTNLTFTGGTLAASGGGSVAWGAITGTLSAQTDLQSALNAKANVAGQVFTGAVSATNLSGTNTGDQTITLTSEATGSGTGSFAVTLSNAAVIGKVLTGYTSGAGTISASDTLLSAIQKLNGNDALKAPLASPTFTGTVTLPAGQVVNGVTLTTGGSATTYLNAAGAYTTPAGGGGGSVAWGGIAGTLSDQTDLQSALNAKAPLASPALTGVPTAPTAANGTNTTQIATTAFVLANAGGGGGGVDPTDPSVSQVFVDDFLFTSTETGEVGALGWSFTNGSVAGVTPAMVGRPGIIRRTSGATAAQVASFYPGATTTTPSSQFQDIDEITWIVSANVVAADYALRFGIFSSTSVADPTGAYFERTATDTNWFAKCRDSTATRTDTGVALSTSFVKLKVRRATNTDYRFSINGGSEIAITTDTPFSTTGCIPGFLIVPTTTTARAVDVDFVSAKFRAVSR